MRVDTDRSSSPTVRQGSQPTPEPSLTVGLLPRYQDGLPFSHQSSAGHPIYSTSYSASYLKNPICSCVATRPPTFMRISQLRKADLNRRQRVENPTANRISVVSIYETLDSVDLSQV